MVIEVNPRQHPRLVMITSLDKLKTEKPLDVYLEGATHSVQLELLKNGLIKLRPAR